MPTPKLSTVQIERLTVLAEIAATAEREHLLAVARDLPREEIKRLGVLSSSASAEFFTASGFRGFLEGDLVRLTRRGPYTGVEGVISSLVRGGYLQIKWPAGDPCWNNGHIVPNSSEVELVEPAPSVTDAANG